MKVTEILGIRVVKERLVVPNKSGFYHDVFRAWWDRFCLKGSGLIIGDEAEVKSVLKKEYSEITEIYTVEIEGSPDILWDITKPFPEKDIPSIDWIICHAVLEHVVDPVSAMKNMSFLLNPGGLLYLYVPGPGFPEHKFPIDCYRFLKDSLFAFQGLADLNIVDLYTDVNNCMALYRK